MIRKQNILFFIPELTQRWGGVRQYASGLLKLFIELTAEYNFIILHDNDDPVILSVVNSCKDFQLTNSSTSRLNMLEKLVEKSKKYVSKIFGKIGIKINIVEKTYLNKIIDKYNIDIIHCPYQFIPKINGVKLISTMHDVQELYFPEFFSADERAYRAVNYLDFIKRSDKIIVSYQHIKNDLVKFFGVKQNLISILLLKMDNLWYSKFNNNDIKTLDIKFDKYIFYPANSWFHKNHLNLIRTIYYLKTQKDLKINILFTGDFKSEQGEFIKSEIKKLDLEQQITILGIVSEEELYSIYQHTQGVVIPTLYEAGSFPLMESILMNIPVICSNVTSLPETIGNLEFTFNPNSIEDIADKIQKLWNDENYRNLSIKNNNKQRERLIETGARTILSTIYKELI